MADRVRGLWKTVRGLVLRGSVERELSDEVAFHLAMETEQNLRRGMTPAAARRAALLSFRGVERYKEEVRASRRARWLEEFGRDVVLAVRSIRRSPGLSAVVVLTLGLGVGAVASIFSVVDTALLRPLPWPDADRLVLVRETTPDGQPFSVSQPNYLDFRGGSAALTELAAFQEVTPSLTGAGEPERLTGFRATHSLFTLLGARPVLGRTYGAAEDRPGEGGAVVVLSHGLWQRRFGGDSAVVGRRLVLDGEPRRVIGVLAPDFEFFRGDVWLPLAPDIGSDRGDHWLDVMGRLAPGATRQGAAAELAGISRALAEDHPAMTGWGVEVRDLRAALVGPEFRRASLVLTGAVALLLLMACANAANLLLARATARRSDLGVRAALGAGQGRLLRQLLAESAVLAAGGAAVGLLLGAWVVGALRAAAPAAIPRAEHLALDLRVVAVAAGAGLLTALLAGALPAIQAARTDAAEHLRSGGRAGPSRRQRRVRDGLVVAQVAVAVVLLIGAGLLIRSFLRLQAVDPGFRTENVWAAPFQLAGAGYDDGARRYFAYRDIIENARGIPGVVATAGAFVDPFSGMSLSNNVTPVERAGEVSEAGYLQARWRVVSPDYFETMDVPLLAGRGFTGDDRFGNPATVIITRALADRLWPGQDAIGRQLFWGGTTGEPRTVIGVVGDVQDVALEADPAPLMFVSYQQLALPAMTLLVRTDGPVPGLADAVRRAVWSVDPTVPVPLVRPLTHSRAAAVAGPRFNALVLAAFAAAALALAAVGLYGLLSFVVARRTRELGVRRALGASDGAVSTMVVRRGLLLTGVGAAVGLVAALALGRVIEGLLFRIGGADPLTLAAVVVLFAAVATVASWFPARRAARVDPLTALRAE